MQDKAVLEEHGPVNVHERIKEMCKTARSALGYTNQDICDKICENFGFEDFSINTVNNFFSERSKATTVYTTGYICAVLGISIDAVFGMKNNCFSEEETELRKMLAELEEKNRYNEQKIVFLEKSEKEKEERIEQAHAALEHYRKESVVNRKKIQPWVLFATFILLAMAIAFICFYILKYDIGNPEYGLFSRGLNLPEMKNSVKQLFSIP